MYTAYGRPDKYHLLEEYTTLVKRMAFQLKAKLPPSVEVDDLIQAGMMGLLDAFSRYEEGYGTQFETYATQRVRGAMLDELRSSDWAPRSLRQSMRKIEEAIQLLQQQLGRAPLEKDIAKQLDMPLEAYQKILADSQGHQLIYYDDLSDEDKEDGTLNVEQSEQIGNPLYALLDDHFKSALIQAIECLPEREKLVMALYYDQELNLKEVGAVMGVSESRISQLHTQAIARLRGFLREEAWIGPV